MRHDQRDEILAIRPLDGTSSVKAFVDIRVGAIALKGCKIVQQPDKPAWLAMPAIKTGRAWQNVVEVTSKDLRERMTAAAVEAWERGREGRPKDDGGVPW
jgi:DNA-binding cell septation regulator SpoVG